MLILIIKWWYGPGWLQAFKNIQTHTAGVGSSFSIPKLLKTLFSPWKRIISYPGKSLEEHFRAFLDNLISRLVGFVVRIFVLLTAAVMTLFTAVFYGVLAIVWPLLPLAIVYCIVRGVIG